MAMGVRNRLELQEQRERGLLAVIASAQDLSSRLHLDELLGTIVSRARNLLGSDVAWLSTYDADRGEFHVLVVDGALSRGPSAMVARRDRGVAGVVMSTRLPFTTRTICTTSASRTMRSSTTPSARKASPRWLACR